MLLPYRLQMQQYKVRVIRIVIACIFLKQFSISSNSNGKGNQMSKLLRSME